MPSSTSSSDALLRSHDDDDDLQQLPLPAAAERNPPVHDVRRDVPAHNWQVMAVSAALGCVLMLGLWERHVRTLGYQPDYDDTTSLWVQARQQAANARPEQLVLVGDSRTLFDLDLDVLQQAGRGPRPIQLAKVGSNPVVILADLAKGAGYAGTTLVGVAPPLFAAAGGPPISGPQRYVRKYHNWSPADAWEHALSLPLQEHLAFIQQEDLTLRQLIMQLPLPRREAAFTPDLPPHFSQLDLDRRTRMTERAEHDPLLMRRIQQIWPPLFSGPPKPAGLSQVVWQKILEDGWNANLQQAKAAVAAIRARGGNVFFVRHPSSGELRALEDRITPRDQFWERLLQETGAQGIYDQDYPELSSFECPEFSHLSANDSVEYTRRLSNILQHKGWL
jgi:hypothetical protein